jgi:hypothetical protein
MEFIKVGKVGRVAHITIDHPPMNTSSTESWLLNMRTNDTVRAMLLDSANQKPRLGFFHRATLYRLAPLRMVPPQTAEWLCESSQEWSGTRTSLMPHPKTLALCRDLRRRFGKVRLLIAPRAKLFTRTAMA